MYHQKQALSVNRNDLLENFSKALKLAIHVYWEGKPVSSAMFAKEFNRHCEQSEEVSREQIRRWVRGDAFPEPMSFAILHQWLKLDVNTIYETIPTVERFISSATAGRNLKKASESEVLEISKNMEEYPSEKRMGRVIQSLDDISEVVRSLKTYLIS